MKIYGNWGFWVLISLSMIIILVLVGILLLSGEKFDLVELNYYDRELKYQSQINKQQRTSKLKDNFKIKLINDQLVLKFPSDFKSKKLNGKIRFFRPSDASLDIDLSVNVNDSLLQTVNVKNIIKGMWIIKIDWTVNETSYFYEEEVIL